MQSSNMIFFLSIYEEDTLSPPAKSIIFSKDHLGGGWGGGHPRNF
jgi:hypothetical protein